jgi:hypothetical protein
MSRVSNIIIGQWLGYYKYGPEYGDLHGDKVSFSIIIDDLDNGQFQGRCHDLEGIGAIPDVASIKGYIEGNYIHFIKEYPFNYALNDDGSLIEEKLSTKPILTYTGEYNERTKSFQGTWEIEVTIGSTIQGDDLCIWTGTWEMSKA